MNRTEFTEMMQDIMRELQDPNANFAARFGENAMDPAQIEQVAAVALTAVDHYYSHLTLLRSVRLQLEEADL